MEFPQTHRQPADFRPAVTEGHLAAAIPKLSALELAGRKRSNLLSILGNLIDGEQPGKRLRIEIQHREAETRARPLDAKTCEHGCLPQHGQVIRDRVFASVHSAMLAMVRRRPSPGV